MEKCHDEVLEIFGFFSRIAKKIKLELKYLSSILEYVQDLNFKLIWAFKILNHNFQKLNLYVLPQNILWVHVNVTKVISKKLLVKSSENYFIFVPAFYLIICLMKTPKNFEKIANLKIWELVSFWGVKSHFGKLALKWCIFRQEKKYFNQYYVIVFDPIKI